MEITSDGHLKFIEEIAQEDASGLLKAHESYGDSWKRRGGVGAYMVMIRKFDRMERAAAKAGWDIFQAVRNDPRVESVVDDIRDARRYLLLIESALREMGLVASGNHRDNVPEGGVPRSFSDADNPHAHETILPSGCSSVEQAETVALKKVSDCPTAEHVDILLANRQAQGACDDVNCGSPGCDAVRQAAEDVKSPTHTNFEQQVNRDRSAAHDPHNKGER